MTATASPVRMLPSAPMRFGVWRSLPVSRLSPRSPVVENWQAEWRLPRVLPVSTTHFVLACLALLAAGGALLAWLGGSWGPWLPGLAMAAVLAAAITVLLARASCDGEHIAMRQGLVRVTRRQAGHAETTDFLPHWVRIEPELHDRSLIRLSGQGRTVTIGLHVPPNERRQLANEIRWALRQLDE